MFIYHMKDSSALIFALVFFSLDHASTDCPLCCGVACVYRGFWYFQE